MEPTRPGQGGGGWAYTMWNHTPRSHVLTRINHVLCVMPCNLIPTAVSNPPPYVLIVGLLASGVLYLVIIMVSNCVLVSFCIIDTTIVPRIVIL